MVKRIFDFIRYILFSSIAVLLFCGTYYSLSESFPNDGDLGDGERFRNLPKDSLDVLVIGSSHAQYSFNPAFFYQDTGLYSYVLGSACQPLSISYKMLKEALKTQKPKVVIQEVFTAMPLKGGCEGVSCYIIPSFMMTGEERYSTLKSLPQEKQDLYLNPFVSAHNEWKNDDISFNEIYLNSKESINKLINNNESNTNEISENFGYIEIYPELPVKNYWNPNRIYKDTYDELLSEDKEALNDIKKLCDENDISFLLYKTPIDSLDDKNLTYLHRVWEWADQNNVPYIDFIDKSPELDFYMCIHSDSFHSYITGASIITKEMANFFNSNYQIDHTINDVLEEKYNSSAQGFTLSYLNFEYDPSKYLSRLSNYSGPILIINNSERHNNVLDDFLNNYGISNNSICFFDNRELVDSSESCVGINYKDHEIYADFSTIEIDNSIEGDISDFTIVVFANDLSYYEIVETNTSNMWKKGFNWYNE